MTPTGTNNMDLLQLCSQLHHTVDQLQGGIAGRRKRNRKSGASVRSKKTQERKAAATESENDLANVCTDDTTMTNSVADASTNLIAPSPVKGAYLIKKAVVEKRHAAKEKEDADAKAAQKAVLENITCSQRKGGCRCQSSAEGCCGKTTCRLRKGGC